MDKTELYTRLEQPVITEDLIQQFRHFACRCEELKLYALAAYVFQKLVYYDPDNRRLYLERFLANIEATA